MPDVDPNAAYDELFEPLALALGHMVFAAATLEKVLFVDLVQRKARRDGLGSVFANRGISRLERRPAGVLLKELRRLGYEDELAEEAEDVILGRNHLVHHLYMDPEFVLVLASRRGVDRIVGRVEQLASRIRDVVEKVKPGVEVGVEEMFGKTSEELFEIVKRLDADEIEGDDELKSLLEAVQRLPESFKEQ